MGETLYRSRPIIQTFSVYFSGCAYLPCYYLTFHCGFYFIINILVSIFLFKRAAKIQKKRKKEENSEDVLVAKSGKEADF
jgi:hypothetical protein